MDDIGQNVVNVVKEYWKSRKITTCIPPFSTQREYHGMRDVLVAYYFTYNQPTTGIPFQRVYIGGNWQRLSLSRSQRQAWGLPDHYLYVPYQWDVYTGKDVYIVEGISDCQTLWEAGFAAVGVYNLTIVTNPKFRAQLAEFLAYVSPVCVVVCPDGDEMVTREMVKKDKDYRPEGDHVRKWYKAFEEMLIAYPHRFLDLRGLQLGKVDINELVKDYGCNLRQILSEIECAIPTMPEVLTPAKKCLVRQPVKKNFLARHDLKLRSAREFLEYYGIEGEREPNGWYRFLCPVKRHSTEGQTWKTGACGACDNQKYGFWVNCMAGCTQEAVLSAIDPALMEE